MADQWTIAAWITGGSTAWIAFAIACRSLLNNPRGDIETGLAFAAVRVYARLIHRLRVEGAENIPEACRGVRRGRGPAASGPLIVAANHTAGVDPLLIQSACRFEVRWMMARDMLAAPLMWFWEWARVIPVSRTWVESAGGAERSAGASRADSRSALDAIKHLRAGGVLGVFPEGRIETERGRLLPFQPGIGVLAKKTGAAVLPVVIEGTPTGDSAWASLIRPSRSRVRFLPVVEYASTDLDAAAIVEDIRRRLEQGMAAVAAERRDTRGRP